MTKATDRPICTDYCKPHNPCTYLKIRRSEALDWEYFLLPTDGWTGVCKIQRYVIAP
jgi:hypothetical protein